jgi:hypothetical protein
MALSAKRPSKSEVAKEKIMQDVTESGRTRRLNTDIEESLYKRIKLRSVEEDRSISDITRQLWIEYLGN